MNEKITLLDGSQIECYPIAMPEEPVSGELALDTTGQYLQVGKKKAHFVTDKELAERRKQEEIDATLLCKHALLLLANADRIFSDSRMFLAPVRIINGLAYTGTSGFQKPTLGVYLEWWLYHKEASIDAKGRPIWFISGSPLSGSNACSSVDRRGKSHRAQLNGRFSNVWRTFMQVNNRYNEAKGRYLAYSLQEVVDLLEGSTDEKKLFKLHVRMEKFKYDNHIAQLKGSINHYKNLSNEYKEKIRNLLFEQHKEEAEEYYRKCFNLQTVADLADQYFKERRIELRRELRQGRLDNITYQKTLSPLKVKAKDAEFESRKFESEGLSEIFGDDSFYFSFSNIEKLLIDSQNRESEAKAKTI